MFIKDLQHCEEFISGDGALLRELLHPHKADLQLNYSLAHAIVKPGEITFPHRLRTSEVYYILDGKGIMHIDEETREVFPGQAVYIPPLATQRIKNHGDSNLVFLCIVDPAWRAEDEVIL